MHLRIHAGEACFAGAVFLLIGLGMAGCGEKPSFEGVSEPPSTVSTDAMPENATSPGGTLSEAEIAALLQELTQAVRQYAAEQQQRPQTLNDLVAKGYLPTLPQAPPGKKFAINSNLQVYLSE